MKDFCGVPRRLLESERGLQGTWQSAKPFPGRRQDCDGRPDPIRGATGAPGPAHSTTRVPCCAVTTLSNCVSQYLAENGDLFEAAHEKMCLGRLHESLQYQLQLHQNLMFLATHADDDPALERLVFNGTPQQQQQQQARPQPQERPQQPPQWQQPQQQPQQPLQPQPRAAEVQQQVASGSAEFHGHAVDQAAPSMHDPYLDHMIAERRRQRQHGQ